MNSLVNVTIEHGNTCIANYSDDLLLVELLPIKPKRKSTLIFVIQPKGFKIYEGSLDIYAVSFRWEKK